MPSKPKEIDKLTDEQRNELKAYAQWGGRRWKSKLRNDWDNGLQSGYPGEFAFLQQIRNRYPNAINQLY